MKEKAEAEIDILRKQGEHEHVFKTRFCKLIIDHFLRKIHCFHLHSTHLTTFFG